MRKDLSIYSNSLKSSKKRSSHFCSDGGVRGLCGISLSLSIFFLIIWFYRIALPHFYNQSSSVASARNSEKVEVSQPSVTPESSMSSDGTTEENITTSIITSPYTWDIVVDENISIDGVPVSVRLLITSQVLRGHAKELLRNYGGNWFYTVFIPAYLPSVKSSFQSLRTQSVVTSQFESTLTDSANVQIKRLSGKFPLPVVIRQVKVASVKKK